MWRVKQGRFLLVPALLPGLGTAGTLVSVTPAAAQNVDISVHDFSSGTSNLTFNQRGSSGGA